MLTNLSTGSFISFTGISSFDLRNRYRKSKSGAIDVDTVLVLDQRTGVPISTWGRNLFYMPHGLHIDNEGNTWITDVALHQVFKVTIDGLLHSALTYFRWLHLSRPADSQEKSVAPSITGGP